MGMQQHREMVRESRVLKRTRKETRTFDHAKIKRSRVASRYKNLRSMRFRLIIKVEAKMNEKRTMTIFGCGTITECWKIVFGKNYRRALKQF